MSAKAKPGGCIIADSVNLGKTFSALAIIKDDALRNDCVLVRVPKRLRDNWTIYKTNDRRNTASLLDPVVLALPIS
jgi:SNF2 family DNA or RNA helicase